jgi:hypothetical protein
MTQYWGHFGGAAGTSGRDTPLMRLISAAGACGGVLTLAVNVLYVTILASQGEGSLAQAALWVVVFAAVGLLGLAASFTARPRLRLQIFALCAFVMLVVGLLAIFSIGILLLVAGVLFSSAAVHARRSTAAEA